jgi:hypothetical protein
MMAKRTPEWIQDMMTFMTQFNADLEKPENY